jgi:hypothetical protein
MLSIYTMNSRSVCAGEYSHMDKKAMGSVWEKSQGSIRRTRSAAPAASSRTQLAQTFFAPFSIRKYAEQEDVMSIGRSGVVSRAAQDHATPCSSGVT